MKPLISYHPVHTKQNTREIINQLLVGQLNKKQNLVILQGQQTVPLAGPSYHRQMTEWRRGPFRAERQAWLISCTNYIPYMLRVLY